MISFARAFKTYGIITGIVVILSASSLLVHYRGLGSPGNPTTSVNGRDAYAANSLDDSGLAPNRSLPKTVRSKCKTAKVKDLQKEVQFNGFDRVVYNRVGKCGSRSLLNILQALAKKNGFTFFKDPKMKHWKTRFPLPEQITLVQSVDKIPAPFFFNRHFHYIDFARFGAKQPVYINMIRDPFDRLVSSYYFKRFGDLRSSDRGGQLMTEEDKLRSFDACVLEDQVECQRGIHYIIPFFCGQRPGCKDPSRWALEKAKDNVLDKFLVVGILEEFNDTLRVLEHLLPKVFKGATDLWDNPTDTLLQLYNSSRTVRKQKPSLFIREKMRQRMKLEYEFYYFVRDVFHNLKNNLGIPSTWEQKAYRNDPLYKEILASRSTKLSSYAKEQPVISVDDNKDYDEDEYEDERDGKDDPGEVPEGVRLDETQKHDIDTDESKVLTQKVYSNLRDENAVLHGSLQNEQLPRAESDLKDVLQQAQGVVNFAVMDSPISRTSEKIPQKPTPKTYDTDDTDADDYEEKEDGR